MKILVDGQVVQCNTDVKIIVPLIDDEEGGDLHVTATAEGLLYDRVVEGEIVETKSAEWVDITCAVFSYWLRR